MDKKEIQKKDRCDMCSGSNITIKCEKCNQFRCDYVKCEKMHKLVCISDEEKDKIKTKNMHYIQNHQQLINLLRIFISRRKRDIIRDNVINYPKIICLGDIEDKGLLIVGYINETVAELNSILTKEDQEKIEYGDYRVIIVEHYIEISDTKLVTYIGHSVLMLNRIENNNDDVVHESIQLLTHGYRDNNGILVDIIYTKEFRRVLNNKNKGLLMGIKMDEFFRVYIDENDRDRQIKYRKNREDKT